MKPAAAVLTLFLLVLSGCASNRLVISDSASRAREAAALNQQIADDYRKAGAATAAGPAQTRANADSARAEKKPGSFFEWLFDVALSSWLESGTPPQQPVRR
jgi:outer membrane murein-binding lipoprotein Lpp